LLSKKHFIKRIRFAKHLLLSSLLPRLPILCL